jgi:hypothetical protein
MTSASANRRRDIVTPAKGTPMSNRSVLNTRILPVIVVASAAFARPGAARAGNAAPLGQEIGVATLTSVQLTVGKATSLADGGVNKFTGGRMLSGDGKGLGIDGITKITFIFDKGSVLQGVIMTLPKNFKPTYEMLRKKYTPISRQIPFVGDTNARFSQGASVIELNAPHMSFEMTLSYLSETLLASFKTRSAHDKERHDRDQEDKL